MNQNQKPFIIAELSGNHNQSLEKALQIIESAAQSGVDALKIQTYTPNTLTLDVRKPNFFIEDKNSLWAGEYLYDLYKVAYTPWEWHKEIFSKCKELGIICFSSPFDKTAVDFLEELDCPIYKIASFENTDHPLLKKVAQTGKPVIMSTGMMSLAELDESVQVLKQNGCKDLTLLKCTSTYPASPENSNLSIIPHLKQLYPEYKIGLSDHTLGIGVSIGAIALGAEVIEKHFTLSRAEGGVDSSFSMEPHEMKQLVEECHNIYKAIGEIKYGATEAEKKSLKFKRSIYIAEDMKAGDVFNEKNLQVVRPGYGLEPKYYELFLGKKIKKDAEKGTALTWELIL